MRSTKENDKNQVILPRNVYTQKEKEEEEEEEAETEKDSK